jgi:hypothetical protein
MASYFKYFPSLLHSNTVATNIITRIRFEESVRKNVVAFFPHVVEEGQRPDQIAEGYYGDPSYDWVVYLTNNIIDPFHQWPKTQQIFDDFIVSKYGSSEIAQQQTAFYRVNYDNDDRVLSPSAYAALSSIQKQYWTPILNQNNIIINYQRKEIEDAIETNKVVSLVGTFGSVAEGTIIKQSSSVKGTVSFANSTNIVIKHVSGTWAANTPITTVLTNTSVTANITSVSTIASSLDADEVSYWSPVSVFDVEFETNESLRHIELVIPSYIDVIEKDMRGLLKS